MLKPYLFLVAAGLCQASPTICFRNTTTTVRKEVLDRPTTIDEYHCKIICFEKTECLSYTFPTPNECVLLGKQDHDGMCMKPYQEWIKKDTDADCPDVFAQPEIDAGYVPNPALAKATALDEVTLNSWSACAKGAFLDTTLPDNLHQLQFEENFRVEWDGKLGSWQFTKQIINYPEETKTNITVYIRAARCYRIEDASQFAGELPTMAPLGNFVLAGKVQRYGQILPCDDGDKGHQFHCFADYLTGTFAYGALAGVNRGLYWGSVICVDGVWAYMGKQAVYKISRGICAHMPF